MNLLSLLVDMRKSLTEVDPSANSKDRGAVVIFVCFLYLEVFTEN